MLPKNILYTHKNQYFTRKEISEKLLISGIEPGDMIMVHSDISTFGKLGNVDSRDQFFHQLLLAFQRALGSEGTLFVPAYTYSFCKNEPFDLINTPSTVGSFTEYIRTHTDSFRSSDPIFSHAGIGKYARELLRDVSDDCFGVESFFDRLYKAGGKLVNFGNEFDITFLHYIERHAGVNYRYNKSFEGTVIEPSGLEERKRVTYYVRALPEDGFDVEYDMTLLGDELEKRNLLKRVTLGAGHILTTSINDCYDVGLEMLKRDPYAFLTKKPIL